MIAYLPEVVRLSLAVGTDEMAPLARALQEASRALTHSIMSEATMQPRIPRAPLLRDLGFALDGLEPAEIEALWNQHSTLIQKAQSVPGVEAIARFYLGRAEVRLGFPYFGSRFNLARSGSRIRLVDSAARSNVFFISLEETPDPIRFQSTQLTLQTLGPANHSWHFAWPEQTRSLDATHSGRSFNERRLACPTFLR